MKKIEIPLMFCFDNNYVIPAGVAFYSLLKNCNKKYNYSLFVLHTDITKENQEKLVETIKEFNGFSTLSFINMENKFESLWETISTKGHFSKEVMYKVLVASIFPQYDKIIVSDVDVVFLNDISESFFAIDCEEDYYLAGIRMIGKYDWYLNIYKKHFSDEEIKKLSGFCGGYIVFNLKKIREDDLEKKFIKCFKENGKRINQMEQDILNLCCYPKTKLLPLKYLACSYMWDVYKTDYDKETDGFYDKTEIEDAMINTVQLHYATSTKPWKYVDCTKSEVWFEYLSQTIFLKDYLKDLPNKIYLTEKRIQEIKESINKENNNTNSPNSKKLIPKLEKYKIYWYIKYFLKNPLFLFKKDFYKKISRKIIPKLEKYKIYWYIKYFLKNPLFLFKKDFYKKIKKKIYNQNIIIIDDIYPGSYSPFRNQEYNYYLNVFHNSKVFTSGKNLKFFNKNLRVKNVVKNFINSNIQYENRIFVNNKKNEYILATYPKCLAVLTFLENVISNINILEKYDIPFIFTLYPGGGLILNDSQCDNKLKRIFNSKCFEKVIVTQDIVKNYLIEKKLCPLEKMEFIFGVVTPKLMLSAGTHKKEYFGYGKDNLKICFVAHKYTKNGKDKGFDIFINTCKEIKSLHYDNISFHVVGEFTENDIKDKEQAKMINFHGVLSTTELQKFFEQMDIIISPTKPYIITKGSFDGFPTACSTEAMLNKVLLITTDELNLNGNRFKDGKDLIIVSPNPKEITSKVKELYNNPKLIKKISNNGHKKAQEIYSCRNQLYKRIKIIKKVYKGICR